ncbi:hypothetical protein AVEN_16688-1, partial [Araneus ventricosus]
NIPPLEQVTGKQHFVAQITQTNSKSILQQHTFSKVLSVNLATTQLCEAAEDIVDSFQHLRNFSLLKREETHATDCVLRALSDNCGKLVEEASLEFVRRSKSLEYACSGEEAQSVLDELDNLDLSEDKKRSVALLLTKLVEENSD